MKKAFVLLCMVVVGLTVVIAVIWALPLTMNVNAVALIGSAAGLAAVVGIMYLGRNWLWP